MTEEHTRSALPQIFLGALFLALALLGSTWMGTQALDRFKNANNTIAVTGSARKAIRSDFATWRSTVSCEAPTRAEGYRLIQEQTRQVEDYLRQEQHVPNTALTLGPLSVNSLPEYLDNGRTSGRIRGYQLRQSFEVRLPDVDKIAALSRDSMALLDRGLTFESDPPEYLYTKLADLRVEMLEQATQDARERAQRILASVGNHLGPVRSVRTGVFQITRPHSTEVSDYGSYDTGTIDKDITAVLTLTFAVD